MDETQSTNCQQTWERFIEAERRELEARRDDQLAKLIGEALPGESPVELKRMALEDKRRAEEGLVELRGSHKVWYKHIDELTPEDRQARAAADKARAAWLRARLEARTNRE